MSYIVQKKNRVLRIPEEKIEEYAKMGYEVRDESGKLISEAMITSMAEAQEAIAVAKKNDELKAKLEEATKENEALKAKISELEAKKSTSRTSKKAEQEA